VKLGASLLMSVELQLHSCSERSGVHINKQSAHIAVQCGHIVRHLQSKSPSAMATRAAARNVCLATRLDM
jgi:hypothetical protein